MSFYTIKKERIQNLIDNLMKGHSLISPVKRNGILSFGKIRSSSEFAFSGDNTDISPKGNLFQQREVMFFYKDGKVKEVEGYEEKGILFGMRPCDAKSLSLLDKVFIEDGNFEDTYYKEKRKDLMIFGFACNKPRATCFCTSFGIGPFYKEGSDVFMVEIGEKVLLESITKEGEEILENQGLEYAQSQDIEKIDGLKRDALSLMSDGFDIKSFIDRLQELFEDKIWDEVQLKCIGCGICTFFCPTCHCFDILDEGDEREGMRLRIWDSCQFPLFTLHASGHQPRETQKERFRQRIMHKFNYFLSRFNECACVGCGRCIINCPVNIDIREIIKKIGG